MCTFIPTKLQDVIFPTDHYVLNEYTGYTLYILYQFFLYWARACNVALIGIIAIIRTWHYCTIHRTLIVKPRNSFHDKEIFSLLSSIIVQSDSHGITQLL